MGKVGRIYIVPMRRVREGRTDYRQRLKLLLSGQPRFVVRKSLNHISCQVVKYDKGGDRVIASAHSSQLKRYGWLAPCGNIPAAYLTGLLAALKARQAGIKDCVLDAGLYRSTKGSRIYAALKGGLDGGLVIPFSPQILPSEDRLAGKAIAEWAASLNRTDPDRYKRMFSFYLKVGVRPEDLTQHFEQVKRAILAKSV